MQEPLFKAFKDKVPKVVIASVEIVSQAFRSSSLKLHIPMSSISSLPYFLVSTEIYVEYIHINFTIFMLISSQSEIPLQQLHPSYCWDENTWGPSRSQIENRFHQIKPWISTMRLSYSQFASLYRNKISGNKVDMFRGHFLYKLTVFLFFPKIMWHTKSQHLEIISGKGLNLPCHIKVFIYDCAFAVDLVPQLWNLNWLPKHCQVFLMPSKKL